MMAELRADPDYTARMLDREQQQIENVVTYELAAQPILRELVASGYAVQSLSALRQVREYSGAISILAQWLPKIENLQVKEDLVRTLSVPWAGPMAVAALIAEFKRITGPQSDEIRWAIANALEVTADDTVFDEIVALATDKKYGGSREMLVLALGNCQNPRAIEVLIALLTDEQVVGHAIMTLGKLRARAARSRIQELLKHPKKWVRAEVTKALAAIDRA
jgi:HEAT repeat protein